VSSCGTCVYRRFHLLFRLKPSAERPTNLKVTRSIIHDMLELVAAIDYKSLETAAVNLDK